MVLKKKQIKEIKNGRRRKIKKKEKEDGSGMVRWREKRPWECSS